MRVRGAALLLLALAALPARAPAQASPLLPPDHWALRAAWRLDALGLAPEYLPAEKSAPRREVARALREAAARAEPDSPGRELAEGAYRRLLEEFPELADTLAAPTPARLGSALAAAYQRDTGRSAPGLAEFEPDRTGALPLPDRDEGWVGAEVAFSPAAPLSLQIAPSLGSEGAEVERWEANLTLGKWSLVAGRAEVGYGIAPERGVLLSGSGTIDRLELVTARPFRFPGFLRRLGPVAFQTFVSRLPGERHPGEPVFAGVRLSGKVHPRFTLAGQRAALIGGDSIEQPVDFGRLAKAFVGLYGGIENQIASVEARWHLPTERLLPLSAYCEWGMEDTSGSFYKVPGILCGAYAPALPGLPAVAMGVERAYFAARCCGNPPWYRHKQFPGGWALREGALGHPLGGEGSEWLGYAAADLLDARLRLDLRGFRRERAGENLFVPGREGASLGVGGEARMRFLPSAEARLAALREWGDGWAEARLTIESRYFF